MNEREEKEGGREKRRRKQREEEEERIEEEDGFCYLNERRPADLCSDLSINLRPDGRTRVITCKGQRESCESRESLLST